MRGGRKLFSVGVLLVRFCPPPLFCPPPWRSLEHHVGELHRKIAEKMYDIRVDNKLSTTSTGWNVARTSTNEMAKTSGHDWQHRQQQPHQQHQHWDWNQDLALHRPIGAGHEWDSYIRQRQQSHLSSTRPTSTTRSAATTWARQQDGGHRARIYLNIFHLEASWRVATWSSAWTKMSAIILPRAPRAHHDLLPDVLSHTITYILSINLPRTKLRSHLAEALHAVPPGLAHQSQNKIKVTLRHFHVQQSPRQHPLGSDRPS